MEKKQNVKYEDIIEILGKIGANIEMLKNPYFSEGGAESLFHNSRISPYGEVYYDEAMVDTERKTVKFRNILDNRAEVTIGVDNLSSDGIVISSSIINNNSNDQVFKSAATIAKVRFDETKDLPLSIETTGLSFNISKKDGNTHEVIGKNYLEQWYDANGIEFKQEEIENQKEVSDSKSELYDIYSKKSAEELISECSTLNTNLIKMGNYRRVKAYRKFADVAGITRQDYENGVQVFSVTCDKIIRENHLDRLNVSIAKDDKYDIEPKEEEKLLSEIEKCFIGSKMKQGLAKYVEGRSKYSYEYMSDEQNKGHTL